MKRKNEQTGAGASASGGAKGATGSGKGEATGAGKPELVPAKSEVEVLKILWKDGPSTVRHVHDTLVKETKSVQYTSTLKLMQVMTEKGMLSRDETPMKHIYMPLLEEQKTMASVLEKFLHSMYNGSISNLLVAFMANDKTSKKEIQKVKALLDKLEKGE
jgi:BlaI family transcriptional regulator, penicillinase repressor